MPNTLTITNNPVYITESDTIDLTVDTEQVIVTIGNGVTDHGSLTGLPDDDHPQYLNVVRGDARYYTQTQLDAFLAGKEDDLGNPLVDGYVLSSTIAGVRSWVVQSGGVPSNRQLTINSVTFDLSADRSWTIAAGVTNVTATTPLASSGGATPDISLTGIVSGTNGGTGVNNGSNLLTVPATGIAALLGIANIFTLGPNQFRAGADGNVALAARRHSSAATGDIFQARNESDTSLYAIDRRGHIQANTTYDLSGGNANLSSRTFTLINGTGVSSTTTGETTRLSVNNTTSDHGGTVRGAFYQVTLDGTQNINNAVGGRFEVNSNSSSAKVGTNLIAGQFFVGTQAGRAFIGQNYIGGQFIVDVSSSATATVAATKSINVITPTKTGAGITITNAYGVYVEAITIGNNNYALYTNAGKVHIGDDIEQSTGKKVGFMGATPVVQQTGGANVTNNVTSGGTNNQIDNWTDLATYANDAAAIRNAIYQLAQLVKQDHDALRLYGLLT